MRLPTSDGGGRDAAGTGQLQLQQPASGVGVGRKLCHAAANLSPRAWEKKHTEKKKSQVATYRKEEVPSGNKVTKKRKVPMRQQESKS